MMNKAKLPEQREDKRRIPGSAFFCLRWVRLGFDPGQRKGLTRVIDALACWGYASPCRKMSGRLVIPVPAVAGFSRFLRTHGDLSTGGAVVYLETGCSFPVTSEWIKHA